MVYVLTDKGKEILKQWKNVDLDKVRIKTGFIANVICKILGASAVTCRYTICVNKAWFPWMQKFSIDGMALLTHELHHTKQYKEMGRINFLLQYILFPKQRRLLESECEEVFLRYKEHLVGENIKEEIVILTEK